jgi:hypothetical protein
MSDVWIITRHVEYEGFSIIFVFATEELAREAIWSLIATGARINAEEGIHYGVTHFYELTEDNKYFHDTQVFEEQLGVDTWYLVRKWPVNGVA